MLYMAALNAFIKNDNQQAMITQLHTLKRNIEERGAKADLENSFPAENFEDLLNIGYNKVTLPAAYGGLGFGIYDMILFQETLASFDAATALSIGWHLGIVGDLYDKKLWDDAHLEDFAKKIVNERALTNRILSEVITGSPTRGGRPGTNAIFSDGQWHVNGHKSFASLSYATTHYITSAWIPEKESIGFFLIPQQSNGLTIKETWDMMGMRGTASHDLIFDDVVLPEDALVELNNKPRGAKVNGWALHIPAVYLGVAQAARDHALEFARTYKPNSLDFPIGQLPHIQEKIGQMELKLTTSRHFLYDVAQKFEDPKTHDYAAGQLGAAKHVVVNNALDIVDIAMRIVGAQSLKTSNPLNRYYRDVRAGLHNPPMDDMTITKLATAALEEN